MTTHLPNTTRFNSPAGAGGAPTAVGRGPTPAQAHRFPNATALKSPQDWGDVGGPPHAQTPPQTQKIPRNCEDFATPHPMPGEGEGEG